MKLPQRKENIELATTKLCFTHRKTMSYTEELKRQPSKSSLNSARLRVPCSEKFITQRSQANATGTAATASSSFDDDTLLSFTLLFFTLLYLGQIHYWLSVTYNHPDSVLLSVCSRSSSPLPLVCSPTDASLHPIW